MARLKALILSCLNSWLISLVIFSSRWLCPGTASRHLIQLMMFQLQEEDWLKLDFLIEHCQILTRLLQFDFSLRSLNLAWFFQLLAELLENISVRGSDCRLQRKRSVSSCLPWKLNHFLHISMLYLHFGRGSPRLFCRVFTLTFSSLSSLVLASPFAKFQAKIFRIQQRSSHPFRVDQDWYALMNCRPGMDASVHFGVTLSSGLSPHTSCFHASHCPAIRLRTHSL